MGRILSGQRGLGKNKKKQKELTTMPPSKVCGAESIEEGRDRRRGVAGKKEKESLAHQLKNFSAHRYI